MFIRNTYHRLIVPLLCALLLASCGDNTPVETPVKIVAFGDSLTAGYRLPAESAVPAHLQRLFAEDGHHGVRILNMGISGDTTDDGISRLNLLLDANPDVVILELGANDMLRQRPADKTRENLEAIIQTLQERGIIIVFCGVDVPNLLAVGNRQLSGYRPMFKALAEEYKLIFYPNFLQGVAGKGAMNLPDGLHPNEQGTAEIADRLYPYVLKAAQEAAKRP